MVAATASPSACARGGLQEDLAGFNTTSWNQQALTTLHRVGVENSLGNDDRVTQLVREGLGFDPQPTESEAESEPEAPSDSNAPAAP